MTLAALKDFDAETAAGILASMARDGLPTPFPDGNGDEYRPQKQAIDAELRERLQLKSGDLSASAKARFDMALTDALQATMASAQELDRTIEEMGQQGRVPPSFYEVVFEKNFRDLFRSFGASSKNMIANVIGNADAVEHLWPDFGDENDNRALSLFVKHFPA